MEPSKFLREELLDEYGKLCWICRQTSKRSLAIDHDHHNGNTRGMLCTRCNLALGYLRDSPELCRRAALYIEHADRKYPFIPNEKRALSFVCWLLLQVGRNDIVGDLAKDAKEDIFARSTKTKWPLKSNSYARIRRYLDFRNACDGALDALKRAWAEYTAACVYDPPASMKTGEED